MIIIDDIKRWLDIQDRKFVLELAMSIVCKYMHLAQEKSSDNDIINLVYEWLDGGEDDKGLAAGRAICAMALIDFEFEFALCDHVIASRKARRQEDLDAVKDPFVVDLMRKSIEVNYPAQVARWASARAGWHDLKRDNVNTAAVISMMLDR